MMKMKNYFLKSTTSLTINFHKHLQFFLLASWSMFVHLTCGKTSQIPVAFFLFTLIIFDYLLHSIVICTLFLNHFAFIVSFAIKQLLINIASFILQKSLHLHSLRKIMNTNDSFSSIYHHHLLPLHYCGEIDQLFWILYMLWISYLISYLIVKWENSHLLKSVSRCDSYFFCFCFSIFAQMLKFLSLHHHHQSHQIFLIISL